MSESQNATAVRRFVDAFNRRDLSVVLSDADPEIQLDEWQEAPGAQTYRGPDGVQAALDGPALEAAGLTPHYDKEKA